MQKKTNIPISACGCPYVTDPVMYMNYRRAVWSWHPWTSGCKLVRNVGSYRHGSVHPGSYFLVMSAAYNPWCFSNRHLLPLARDDTVTSEQLRLINIENFKQLSTYSKVESRHLLEDWNLYSNTCIAILMVIAFVQRRYITFSYFPLRFTRTPWPVMTTVAGILKI